MTRYAGLAVAAALSCLAASSSWQPTRLELPARFDDRSYWELVEELSEPDGYFQSDNLVSNEHSYQFVVPALEALRAERQVYLGVAPDQNFTYLLALRPQMAFIVDIRRGNLLTHLMYKAVFELSRDRADFVSLLFSRPRPDGLTEDTPVEALLAAFAGVPGDEWLFRDNIVLLQHHLTRTRGFALSDEDLRGLDDIYSQFYQQGLDLTYSSRGGPTGRFRSRFPTWREMAAQADAQGRQHGYLASEAAFLWIKSFQENNLLVPVVGDHTGPSALRAVGEWTRRHGATVGAFYTSNVEQYLFRYGTWGRFAENLSALPLTDRSVIIRSVSPRDGFLGVPQGPDGRASVLDPILPLVRDAAGGRVGRYRDLTGRVR